MSPTLSVVIPNYNHGHYLGITLDAILKQSFRPLEVLVVDDASTDNSVEVIQNFSKRDPIVRLLKQTQNKGCNEALVWAFNEAKGDYVVSIGADDLPLPGYFEKSMAMLAKYPQAGLCCSYPTNLDNETGELTNYAINWSPTPRYFTPDEFAEVINGWYIAGNTTIQKKSAYFKAGGFALKENEWHADWFFLFTIAFREGVCFIPESLSSSRMHKHSYSAAGRRDFEQQRKVLTNIIRLLRSPEYRDVLPYFVKGRVMCHFGNDILETVLKDPELWHPEVLMLIQQPLWQSAQHANYLQSEREKFAELHKWAVKAYSEAQTALSQGRFQEALDAFSKIANEAPAFLDSYIGISQVLRASDNPQAAKQILDSALRLAPAYPPFYAELGFITLELGNKEEALSAFQTAISIDNKNSAAQKGLLQLKQLGS